MFDIWRGVVGFVSVRVARREVGCAARSAPCRQSLCPHFQIIRTGQMFPAAACASCGTCVRTNPEPQRTANTPHAWTSRRPPTRTHGEFKATERLRSFFAFRNLGEHLVWTEDVTRAFKYVSLSELLPLISILICSVDAQQTQLLLFTWSFFCVFQATHTSLKAHSWYFNL